jgi:Protein of unknown function (DUF4236)
MATDNVTPIRPPEPPARSHGTRGVSASFGHRGAWYTVGPHGRRTATLGWPGTGLRYTSSTGGGRPSQGQPPATSAWGNLAWVVAIAEFWVWIFTRGAR